MFVATDCPIANAYAPELRAIARQHEADPVRLWLVHCDRTITASVARKHAQEFHLPGTIVIDRNHDLVRALAATTTPEAFVIDRTGKLVYRGRIDDAFPELGTRRPAPTTHELRDAILATLHQRTPPVRATVPIGCAIE